MEVLVAVFFPGPEELVFNSLGGMEKWFNSRLFAHNLKLTLRGHELVLCHLDIAPLEHLVVRRWVTVPY